MDFICASKVIHDHPVLAAVTATLVPFDAEQGDLERYNYSTYRGKCFEFCQICLAADSTLTLEKGWVHLAGHDKEEHFWLSTPEGNIVDPTFKQFGHGRPLAYELFDNKFECDHCSTTFDADADGASHQGRYHFCSSICYGQFVGVI